MNRYKYWYVATCEAQKDLSAEGKRPVYGRGHTPKEAKDDLRKWVDQRRKRCTNRDGVCRLPEYDDWDVKRFNFKKPKFNVGQLVVKIREGDRKIPVKARKVAKVLMVPDHPGLIGNICADVMSVAGLGMSFWENEKYFRLHKPKKTVKRP